MGEISVKVSLANDGDLAMAKRGKLPDGEVRRATIQAVIDTGAVMVLLPQDLVEELGLDILDKAIVALANEEKIELDRAGTLSLRIGNREMKTDCLVGPPQCEALIGQLVLERLDLIIDPLKQTLTPRPESPYLPSLKMK